MSHSYEKFLIMFIFVPAFICSFWQCREDDVNWNKVDPQFKKELGKKKKSSETLLEGILHTKTKLTAEEETRLKEKGVIIESVTGVIITVQFPLCALPFLTSQPNIIFISKPAVHQPLSPSK